MLDSRLAMAKELGATETINAKGSNVVEAIQKLTRGASLNGPALTGANRMRALRGHDSSEDPWPTLEDAHKALYAPQELGR